MEKVKGILAAVKILCKALWSSATRKVLWNCAKNLVRGRAVATGIGIFAAVFDEKGRLLLRQRVETSSLYGKNLSGKYELPGGGVDVADLSENYIGTVYNCLAHELIEEAALQLIYMPLVMSHAWLAKGGLNDLAFVTVLHINHGEVLPSHAYQTLLKGGNLKFVSQEELNSVNIASKRILYLAKAAFRMVEEGRV